MMPGMRARMQVRGAGAAARHPTIQASAHRVRVMAKDWMATGLKLRMRGYRSMGDSVPLVMTTV